MKDTVRVFEGEYSTPVGSIIVSKELSRPKIQFISKKDIAVSVIFKLDGSFDHFEVESIVPEVEVGRISLEPSGVVCVCTHITPYYKGDIIREEPQGILPSFVCSKCKENKEDNNNTKVFSVEVWNATFPQFKV